MDYSNSKLSKFDVEHFSNKKVMTPPGTSSMCGTSMAWMASKSISGRRPFAWSLAASSPVGPHTFLRMSSWIESRTSGFRQFRCFHSLSAASPSLFFCKNYSGKVNDSGLTSVKDGLCVRLLQWNSNHHLLPQKRPRIPRMIPLDLFASFRRAIPHADLRPLCHNRTRANRGCCNPCSDALGRYREADEMLSLWRHIVVDNPSHLFSWTNHFSNSTCPVT